VTKADAHTESQTTPRPLTDADLAEIEKRADKANDGPWTRVSNAVDQRVVRLNSNGTVYEIATCEDAVTKHSDADFIAHAREDVPRLLVTIDADRLELARLRRTVASAIRSLDDVLEIPVGIPRVSAIQRSLRAILGAEAGTSTADRLELARLRRIESRAKEMAERLKFDSSDRNCIVDTILTGATWRDGVRILGEGELQ
jgi:hypothetical protein